MSYEEQRTAEITVSAKFWAYFSTIVACMLTLGIIGCVVEQELDRQHQREMIDRGYEEVIEPTPGSDGVISYYRKSE